jgi:tetratricopeptide (TPR) repeat protein
VIPSVTAPFDEPTLQRLAPLLAPAGLEFEIRFFESARRRDPDSQPVLEALGHAYTRRGRLEDGLAVDRRLAQLRPKDPIVHYNLACSYSLLGSKEDGLDALERAIALGYDDLEHLENDRDLDGIRGEERFVALVEKIR